MEIKKAVRISANPLFTRQARALTLATLLPFRPHWTPEGDGFTVTVTVDRHDGTSWRQTLRLVSHPCHLGGWRHFFACPECGARGLALYWTADRFFVCRRCARLRYVSQTWSAASRLWPVYDVIASDLRQRPGVKPSRYFRYNLLAIGNFARHLRLLTRQIEAREKKTTVGVRARRGHQTLRAPR